MAETPPCGLPLKLPVLWFLVLVLVVLVVVVVVLCPPGLFLPALLEVLITCWYDSSTVPVIGLLTLLWITTAGFFFFNS